MKGVVPCCTDHIKISKIIIGEGGVLLIMKQNKIIKSKHLMKINLMTMMVLLLKTT